MLSPTSPAWAREHDKAFHGLVLGSLAPSASSSCRKIAAVDKGNGAQGARCLVIGLRGSVAKSGSDVKWCRCQARGCQDERRIAFMKHAQAL